MPSEIPWWEELRRNMPVVKKWAYFDHAAVAPLTGPAKEILIQWTCDATANGAINWSHWRKQVEDARNLGASLLGADRDEIALIRNTTEGINIVAEGFPWREGDNVVTLAGEFPSNLYPWLNLADRGVEARLVPTQNERIDLSQVAAACDNRTRILSVSWVGYATGWRNDVAALAEIAHQKGAFLFLDAIQGLGVFPLDVTQTPVDFLAADGHKWLLGPEGAGLFYIRKEHLDLLRPTGVGWNSVQQAGDFSNRSLQLKSSAGRYEGGTYNMGGVAALAGSLKCLLACEVRRLSERILEITDVLCERLVESGAEIVSCRDGEHRSGIVAFELPGQNPLTVRQRCRDRAVIVNCRAGRLRVSPHAYTNTDDVERLIDAIKF